MFESNAVANRDAELGGNCMPEVFTVTLNPAIDQMLYLKKFEPAVTNRLSSSRPWLGGKGTHVSLDLLDMGQQNKAMGIAHGETGKEVIRFLEERGIETCFQLYEGAETRTNYILIEEDGRTTTLSSRGKMLTEEEIGAFILFLRAHLSKGDWMILAGDASNCPDPFIYKRIMEELKDLNLRVFMDASGETLRQCAPAQPFLIKPNRDELAYLTDSPVDTEEEVFEAVRKMDRYGIPIVAVSLGGDGSLVKKDGELYRVFSPEVHVINTNGCGDCFLAGLACGLLKDLPFEDTLRLAAATSAATAESEFTVGYDVARAEELKPLVRIEKH